MDAGASCRYGDPRAATSHVTHQVPSPPKYKRKGRVGNWSDYDRALVERGNLTIWLSPDAIARWNAKPSGRRGGQRKYSDLGIETALTPRLLLQLPLR
ncbi:MAG: hypothetical protein ACJAUC_003098 [Planctomycetota bacterium]|jgi:hypothetical protein